MANSQLDGWLHRLACWLNTVRGLLYDLEALGTIPSGTPEERAAACWEALALLGVPSVAEHTDPGKVVLDGIAAALDKNTADSIVHRLRELLTRLDLTLAASVEASGSVLEGMVRTSDFGPAGIVVTSLAASMHRIAFGRLDCLPAEHRLRSVFAVDDCIADAVHGPLLCLGLASEGPSGTLPHRWVDLASVQRLTRQRREAQRREAEDKRAEEERRKVADEERRRNDPRLASREFERRLAALESSLEN